MCSWLDSKNPSRSSSTPGLAGLAAKAIEEESRDRATLLTHEIGMNLSRLLVMTASELRGSASSRRPGALPNDCWPSPTFNSADTRTSRPPTSRWATAYMQLNKNAWKCDDRVAIVRNLELAIDATHRHAPVLDPNHPIARSHLDQRQRKLRGLISPDPKKEPVNPRAYETAMHW